MAKFKAEDKSEIKIRKTTEIIDNTNKFFENIFFLVVQKYVTICRSLVF